MNWTKDKPTIPGWYWSYHKDLGGLQINYIWKDYTFYDPGVWWYGPVSPPPELPKE